MTITRREKEREKFKRSNVRFDFLSSSQELGAMWDSVRAMMSRLGGIYKGIGKRCDEYLQFEWPGISLALRHMAYKLELCGGTCNIWKSIQK